MADIDSPLTSPRSSAPTEPLSDASNEAAPAYDNTRRTALTNGQPVSTRVPSSEARSALQGTNNDAPLDDDDDDDDEGPPSKVYGLTRPLAVGDTRRRKNGSESSLTTQSESDGDDVPLASASLAPPALRSNWRMSDGGSELSDLSDDGERAALSPEVYRSRPGKLSSPLKRPLSPSTRAEATELDGSSGESDAPSPRSPLPISAPILAVNGRKRRRSTASSSRSAKSPRLSVERILSSPLTAPMMADEAVDQARRDERTFT